MEGHSLTSNAIIDSNNDSLVTVHTENKSFSFDVICLNYSFGGKALSTALSAELA